MKVASTKKISHTNTSTYVPARPGPVSHAALQNKSLAKLPGEELPDFHRHDARTIVRDFAPPPNSSASSAPPLHSNPQMAKRPSVNKPDSQRDNLIHKTRLFKRAKKKKLPVPLLPRPSCKPPGPSRIADYSAVNRLMYNSRSNSENEDDKTTESDQKKRLEMLDEQLAYREARIQPGVTPDQVSKQIWDLSFRHARELRTEAEAKAAAERHLAGEAPIPHSSEYTALKRSRTSRNTEKKAAAIAYLKAARERTYELGLPSDTVPPDPPPAIPPTDS